MFAFWDNDIDVVLRCFHRHFQNNGITVDYLIYIILSPKQNSSWIKIKLVLIAAENIFTQQPLVALTTYVDVDYVQRRFHFMLPFGSTVLKEYIKVNSPFFLIFFRREYIAGSVYNKFQTPMLCSIRSFNFLIMFLRYSYTLIIFPCIFSSLAILIRIFKTTKIFRLWPISFRIPWWISFNIFTGSFKITVYFQICNLRMSTSQ